MSAADLDKQFEDFCARHPEVYAELVRLAREAKAAGKEQLGIRMLWEVCRWNLSFSTPQGEEEFKLNNNLTSRFARRILEREPDLKDFFELRDRDSGEPEVSAEPYRDPRQESLFEVDP